MLRRASSIVAALFLLPSCQSKQLPAVEPKPDSDAVTQPQIGRLKLTSPAFADGAAIPPRYTCDGGDISPPLAWSEVPSTAKSLALVCEDPDAPGRIWTHWIVYDLPPNTSSIPENSSEGEIPVGGKQGVNDFHKTGYGGPCPPGGTHRYFFKLYALDTVSSIPEPDATRTLVMQAMSGHIIQQAQLIGTYHR